MEELPVQPPVRLRVLGAIELVADAGMMDICHMDTDLMGAAGVQLAFDERVPLVITRGLDALEHREGRDRRAGMTSQRGDSAPGMILGAA